MTVTTTDIERLAVKLRAEIDALSACAPAHADMIAAAVLVRLANGASPAAHEHSSRRRVIQG